MIASGLICSPKVVLSDEPTTGLDVTIQAQIIRLVKELQKTRKTSWVWITHDLSLLAGFADRILVMYGGRIVEQALVAKAFIALPTRNITGLPASGNTWNGPALPMT